MSLSETDGKQDEQTEWEKQLTIDWKRMGVLAKEWEIMWGEKNRVKKCQIIFGIFVKDSHLWGTVHPNLIKIILYIKYYANIYLLNR